MVHIGISCYILIMLNKTHTHTLTGAKRREWMGMGVAGMIITSDYGSFPKIPC